MRLNCLQVAAGLGSRLGIRNLSGHEGQLFHGFYPISQLLGFHKVSVPHGEKMQGSARPIAAADLVDWITFHFAPYLIAVKGYRRIALKAQVV